MEENILWLSNLSVRGIRPGLENITQLLEGLGDPQDGLRLIHVAGSDGKGSVCCMMESILRAAGLKVGMFSSPHVISVNECIRIDGVQIDDTDLDSILGKVRGSAERNGCECTNFEALTAAALLSFKEEDVDIGIVEVGMGGRLDSTNVIKPEVTVINNISMEHTRFLGDTLEEIASEKAGIMKPGIPCVTINTGAALDVIRRRADEICCSLNTVNSSEIEIISSSSDHVTMRYNVRTYDVGLPGRYQSRNAALAIEAIHSLVDSESISKYIEKGLSEAHWPYRMERIDDRIVLDVTHTTKGAECLREDVNEIYGKVILVTAMLSDKDLDGVSRILSDIATKVYISSPDSPRAAEADMLAECYRKYHDDVTICKSVGGAVDLALKDDGMILVTGSFRTVEDCLRWLRTR